MLTTLGIAIIIGSFLLTWAARASASGVTRRLTSRAAIEPYFLIIMLGFVMVGAIMIAIGLGVPLGPGAA